MFEYSLLNIHVFMRVYVFVTNTNIIVNEYFSLKQRVRMSLSLLMFMCYVGECKKLKY